ncbi:hypothetical protein MVEN_00553600 [Mycena venus]|uniref:Uncharacterized protein n=1 Tax=Mycena venus TaxID=2733690 RepID=A0A8H7D5F0_9AGAR|nr:hypothetical protein MVEN_00553600 [Mycena venus]
MAPKGHRAAPALARHSRSSSATKLPPVNLQFTQKKVLPRPKQPQHGGQKQRPGFHIASPGDEEEEEDWVSSESGAVTPNPNDDEDSDLGSSESNDNRPAARRTPEAVQRPGDLPRVATARPSDYRKSEVEALRTQPEPRRTITPARAATADTPRIDTSTAFGNGARTAYRESPTPMTPTTAPVSEAPSPSRRRHSRPMSSHSMNKPELRPHPLIRGQSFGQPNLAPAKPSPLLPVAVTADVAQLPVSPSTSPTSPLPSSLARRTSISSARSVATIATTHPAPARSVRGEARHRTFSTLSAASSSAALSSLTHLPAVSRPPTPQMIAFFPPANPHARVDDIHPLLPPPYVSNHLTVLARRTPIREAFDRVVRARQTART